MVEGRMKLDGISTVIEIFKGVIFRTIEVFNSNDSELTESCKIPEYIK
jgi:hypothetical protein